MHQHLMRMQPNMAAYYPSNLTTDHIQQYLDENKSLILKIVESQSSGKLSESAENQARLQRNLIYLAAIADSQPPSPTLNSQQYAGGGNLQQQQQQQMAAQSLVAARSSMYGAQPYPSLQQHGGMSSGGNSGLMLQGGAGSSGGGGFPDFIRGDGARGLGGGSNGGRGGGESLYFKSNEDGN